MYVYYRFVTDLHNWKVCVLYVLRVEAEETAELLSVTDFKRRVLTLKSYRL